MKKLLTLGLSLLAVVAVLSLSACAPKEEQSQPGTDTTTEQPTQPETGGGAPAAPEGGTGGGTTEGGTGGGGQ
jgi:ABC-type oligopeptide transport system substrate-binding subunit